MFHEGICAENLRFSYSEGAEVLCGFFSIWFPVVGPVFRPHWQHLGNVYMILLYFHNKVTT